MLSKAAILPLACSLLLGACATMDQADQTSTLARATLSDAAGASVGTVRIEQSGTALSLVADVRGMSTGQHGIHMHTTGKCEAPGFTSAGGHLNPTAHQHGTMNPAGPHLGDLPNITVAADGTGTLSAPLSGTAATVLASLFDTDGTAIVVHAGPDDYKTDPSGNSGGRVACGVLTQGA
jgi:superoxide dismutase, Cu-Zn family